MTIPWVMLGHVCVWLLPQKMQRAILLLREVLDWPTREMAQWLHLSVPAVNSTLQGPALR